VTRYGISIIGGGRLGRSLGRSLRERGWKIHSVVTRRQAELEAAIQILASLGMKRREALRAVLPLTRQVLENQERLGARAAWTGPLARGDFGVIEARESALHSCPAEYLAESAGGTGACVEPESVLAELTRNSQQSIRPAKATGASA
jgi:Domain of unknown function (DUF2520)